MGGGGTLALEPGALIIVFPLTGELGAEGFKVFVAAIDGPALKVLKHTCRSGVGSLDHFCFHEPKPGDEHGTLNGGVPSEQVLKAVYGRRGMEINGVQSLGEVTQETDSLGVPPLIIPFPE